ncbi:MAG: acyl-CoA synthetase FdrA [Acidimicrobiales bacterium]
MIVKHRIVPNVYQDSVALMVVSSKLLALDGIDAASVVMATPANLENLLAAGLGGHQPAKPSDLLVAVAGEDDACEAALELAAELLAATPGIEGPSTKGTLTQPRPSNLQRAVAADPALNLALISVPGPYAAAEAMKALRLGLSVMIFSDNVSEDHELVLKQYAARQGLMVMGPDCGTAILNGMPLGFANVVRRGPIGVVGASGTGMQEVTSRVHNLGSGISQALGTGGHDLSEAIGGLSMLTGMAALDEDPDTEVIVLISKPPSPSVAATVLHRARELRTPVVVVFLGADPASFTGHGVQAALTLADAADAAVAIIEGRPPPPPPPPTAHIAPDSAAALTAAIDALHQDQQAIRGIFCGGTFCYEAQVLCQRQGLSGGSNTPIAGNTKLHNNAEDAGSTHTFIDMGDDQFTQGRPHPMIDPSLRDERVAHEAANPGTAVLLVDVVLGLGSAADPTSGLIQALNRGRHDAAGPGRQPIVIAHVCGTDGDPQDRARTVSALQAAGVTVASSNAEAARWAAFVATTVTGRTAAAVGGAG